MSQLWVCRLHALRFAPSSFSFLSYLVQPLVNGFSEGVNVFVLGAELGIREVVESVVYCAPNLGRSQFGSQEIDNVSNVNHSDVSSILLQGESCFSRHGPYIILVDVRCNDGILIE